jgi:hypothetical protein
MADYAWSQSVCRPDVLWYGIPGQGTWYYTERFGQHWVGGGIYQRYAQAGWECGNLGPPVKDYQYLSEFGAYGMWFQFGAIWFNGQYWSITIGDYGQNANRLSPDIDGPEHVERPPEHDALVADAAKVGPAPDESTLLP